MTINEAIKIMEDGMDYNFNVFKWNEALDIVIESTKKQIPLEVIGINGSKSIQYGCPKCHRPVTGKYCQCCGQKLDWYGAV